MSASNYDRRSYWQPHVDRWEASGISAKRFCRDNELPYGQFLYWSRQLVRQGKPAAPNGFARVVPAGDVAVAPGLYIALPSGIRIGGIDAGNAAVAAQLLAQL